MKRLHQHKSRLISDLKDGAAKRIFAVLPMWKQHNALVRSHFLLSKRVDALMQSAGIGDPLTTEESEQLDNAHKRLKAVMKMAAHARALEVDIEAGKPTDIDAGWGQL